MTKCLKSLKTSLSRLHGPEQKITMVLIFSSFDFLQLLSNDRLIRVDHRVLAKQAGPRISVPCFFRPQTLGENASRIYGTVKELLSEENPPIYRDVDVNDHMKIYFSKVLDGTSPLLQFRL